ncbi:MAG: hypothetical protein ABIV36_17410 [Sphingobium limneticum]
MVLMENPSPPDFAYAGLGLLLKAAGVPPCRAERLVADLIAEDRAVIRAAIAADLRSQMDEQLIHIRRAVRQTMIQTRHFDQNQHKRSRHHIMTALFIAGLALGAVGTLLLASLSSGQNIQGGCFDEASARTFSVGNVLHGNGPGRLLSGSAGQAQYPAAPKAW